MVGRDAQRCPVGVGGKIGVAAAGANRGHWSPEIVGVLGIEAANDRIRVTGPEDRHHPR